MRDYTGYIFDLDGTVYRGNKCIPGAVEVINELQNNNKKVLFLTNKTIESRERYVEKLHSFGISCSSEQILNPTLVTIDYLRDKYGNPTLYVVGESIIKDQLAAAGFTFAATPDTTDVVVVSWDREFHYSHLDFAYQALKNGAIAIATNPDRTCPIDGGEVPDCGGMIGAIEGTTGQKINTIIGKPSSIMLSTALNILDLKVDQCLMIGDRLETDIYMGVNAGMDTALVLSGVTTKEDLIQQDAPYSPTYVYGSISHILNSDSHVLE